MSCIQIKIITFEIRICIWLKGNMWKWNFMLLDKWGDFICSTVAPLSDLKVEQCEYFRHKIVMHQ